MERAGAVPLLLHGTDATADPEPADGALVVRLVIEPTTSPTKRGSVLSLGTTRACMDGPTEPVDLRVSLRHDDVSGEHALIVTQAVRTVKGLCATFVRTA